MSSETNAKRFRIAFSFAGEKRDFVEATAQILAQRFGEEKVLYDKFHEAEFADADLAFNLPSLYKNDTDLIVAVFCRDYDQKPWCGLEWRAIFSLIKENQSKKILLSRFDLMDGKGIFGLGGFIDLEKKSPEQFASLILQRLALNERRDRNYYLQQAAVNLNPSNIASNQNHIQTSHIYSQAEASLPSEFIEAISPEHRADSLVHLAFSTFCVSLDSDADEPISASVCIVTDAPDRLRKQLQQIPAQIQKDPLVSAQAKTRAQSASLQQLVEDPGTRAIVLREIAVISFSAYLYYCPKEAFDKLSRDERIQKLFINPLVHRLSKKGERFDQAHARLAEMSAYLKQASLAVFSAYNRTVNVPISGAAKYSVLEELSALIAQASAHHLAAPTNAETSNLFENLRTRIRYAENVATGEKHKRDVNPLP
jgi:hypothetical protein